MRSACAVSELRTLAWVAILPPPSSKTISMKAATAPWSPAYTILNALKYCADPRASCLDETQSVARSAFTPTRHRLVAVTGTSISIWVSGIAPLLRVPSTSPWATTSPCASRVTTLRKTALPKMSTRARMRSSTKNGRCGGRRPSKRIVSAYRPWSSTRSAVRVARCTAPSTPAIYGMRLTPTLSTTPVWPAATRSWIPTLARVKATMLTS